MPCQEPPAVNSVPAGCNSSCFIWLSFFAQLSILFTVCLVSTAKALSLSACFCFSCRKLGNFYILIADSLLCLAAFLAEAVFTLSDCICNGKLFFAFYAFKPCFKLGYSFSLSVISSTFPKEPIPASFHTPSEYFKLAVLRLFKLLCSACCFFRIPYLLPAEQSVNNRCHQPERPHYISWASYFLHISLVLSLKIYNSSLHTRHATLSSSIVTSFIPSEVK